MGRRVTGRTGIKEVAERAGVAISSVSRVLSDHPDVSPAMRERVELAVEQLGYQPDMLAQSLRRQATRTVGFVVGDISNPLLSSIALGAETTLRESGYSMLLTNSENSPQLDEEHIRLLVRRRTDGLLLSLASETHDPTIRMLRDSGLPIVLIDRELPESVESGAVLSDHRSGLRDAVRHLIDLGHRRIGLILGSSLRFSRERLLGLRDAFSERGIPDDSTVLRGTLDERFGYDATMRLVSDPDPVTAIVSGGNQLTVGTLRALRERGISIGPAMSLVSCDEVALTEFFTPQIAVVRRDNKNLGKVAAALLLEQALGKKEPRQVMLPTEFVPRGSCARVGT